MSCAGGIGIIPGHTFERMKKQVQFIAHDHKESNRQSQGLEPSLWTPNLGLSPLDHTASSRDLVLQRTGTYLAI